MTARQTAFLHDLAALLRKYDIDELKGQNGLPVPMVFEINDEECDGQILRILRYKDSTFDVESRESCFVIEL